MKTLDCVVCGNYIIYGVDQDQHAQGQKHQNNLKELEKSSIWKEIREEKSHSLVGLEYLVELVRIKGSGKLHVCMLCGVNGKSSVILEHFKDIEHQKKFLVSEKF